jgi:hypothetical protein
MTGQRGANAAAANEPDAPANLPTENSGGDNVPVDLSLGEDWEDDGRSEDHVEPLPISADAYFALTDEEKGQVPRNAMGLPFGYWSWSKEAWSRYGQENPRERFEVNREAPAAAPIVLHGFNPADWEGKKAPSRKPKMAIEWFGEAADSALSDPGNQLIEGLLDGGGLVGKLRRQRKRMRRTHCSPSSAVKSTFDRTTPT